MTDLEPMPGEAAGEPAAPLERPAGGAVIPADFGSVGALQRSARHATFGLAGYTVVALGLIGWSLRRGRLFDALLLLVAMAVTLPPILSYRKQVRERLRALAGGAAPGDVATEGGSTGAPGEPASDHSDDASVADAATGRVSSPPSEA